MLNVGTYLIVSILIQCSSLSVFKSGDQKSWVYSRSKSDSFSDPPAPLTQSVPWAAHCKEAITGMSLLSPLYLFIQGYAEPYSLAMLYQQLCHNKD